MTETDELVRDGDDLHALMERAVTGLQPPTDRLEAHAVTGGRRMRRRRRLGAAALTTAASVAAVAMVLPQLAADPTTARDRTASPADRAPSADTPSPADTPSTYDGPDADPFPDLPPGWWDAPTDRLLAQVEAALPEGVTVTALDPHTRDADTGSVAATLAAPAGPGGFQMLLYPPDVEEIPDPVTTTDAAGNEVTSVWADGPSNLSRVKCGRQARYTDTCEEILGADGDPVGRLTSTLQDGTITFYEATLLGPDDGLVYLSVWNATDEKPGPDTPPSAAVPPLSLEQLRELVEDPAWTSYRP